MFEPKVITDVSMLPKVVETNLGELDAVISEKVAMAQKLVVTNSEDDVVSADKDASELTKMSDRIKRFRIDFVGWWKAPLEKVESTCKDYEKRLTEAAQGLRSKTAEVKELWDAEKRNALEAVWLDMINERFDNPEILKSAHWAAFFDEHTSRKTKGNWLNKGVRESTARDEMLSEIERVDNGLVTLHETIGSESTAIRTVALKAFCQSFETEDALRAVYRYKEEQEAIRKAEEECKERAMQDAKERLERERANPQPKPEPRRIETHEPILETYRICVTGTRESLIALRRYMDDKGIIVRNLDK